MCVIEFSIKVHTAIYITIIMPAAYCSLVCLAKTGFQCRFDFFVTFERLLYCAQPFVIEHCTYSTIIYKTFRLFRVNTQNFLVVARYSLTIRVPSTTPRMPSVFSLKTQKFCEYLNKR